MARPRRKKEVAKNRIEVMYVRIAILDVATLTGRRMVDLSLVRLV